MGQREIAPKALSKKEENMSLKIAGFGTCAVVLSFVMLLALGRRAVGDDGDDVRIASNRIQSEVADVTVGGPAGPVVLRIPGFGELFVAQCRDDGSAPEFGIRNTSTRIVDVFGGEVTLLPFDPVELQFASVLQPGEEGVLPGVS
jgi:hypothetical protein